MQWYAAEDMLIGQEIANVTCLVCLSLRVTAQVQCIRVRAVPVCMQVMELGGELGGKLAAALASLGLLDEELATAQERRTLLEEVVRTPQQLVLIM